MHILLDPFEWGLNSLHSPPFEVCVAHMASWVDFRYITFVFNSLLLKLHIILHQCLICISILEQYVMAPTSLICHPKRDDEVNQKKEVKENQQSFMCIRMCIIILTTELQK